MKLSPSALIFLAASTTTASAFVPTASSSRSFVTELFAKKVFIDGEAGTTGLQVRDRLGSRDDIEIISPPSELRKDEETRKKLINEADAVILCKFVKDRTRMIFDWNSHDMPIEWFYFYIISNSLSNQLVQNEITEIF